MRREEPERQLGSKATSMYSLTLSLALALVASSRLSSAELVPHHHKTHHRTRPLVATTTSSPLPPPPPMTYDAAWARYIVHFTDWCSLSHISLQKEFYNYPVARVFSTSDGPLMVNSTGIPYIYGPLIDSDIQDLMVDDRCSLTMSLAENGWCENKTLDPEDPRCAQVILTGHCVPVKENSDEWKFAKETLFTRHPIMKTWPAGHKWVVLGINIKYISLVNYFGGNKHPSVAEYFDAPPYMSYKKSYYKEEERNEEVKMIY